MTTLARSRHDEALRPVPWRRMAWVTWRQHRPTLAAVAVFLIALAVWLWTAGTSLHAAYAAATACHPASSLACSGLVRSFNGIGNFLTNGIILQSVPVLVGGFAGAPVVARELEAGTFRYAWTQGFGRWRWALAKLVLLAAGVIAAAEAISVVFSWYFQPYFAAGNQSLSLDGFTPFTPGLFDLRQVAFPAWTLAAFAIGCLAGMLIRRVVPAIVATFVIYAGLMFAAGLWLREHYATPVVAGSQNVSDSAWVLSQWWMKGGRFAFTTPPLSLLQQFCPTGPAGPVGPGGEPKTVAIAQCLTPHGYTPWSSYQPASRFWMFQFIEAGWLVALSVLLLAATVWLVRRRAA
jgi:hypothetical protein